MVTRFADKTDEAVTFISKIAYLSRDENRVCVIVPKYLRRLVSRNSVYTVVLTPLGTIARR